MRKNDVDGNEEWRGNKALFPKIDVFRREARGSRIELH